VTELGKVRPDRPAREATAPDAPTLQAVRAVPPAPPWAVVAAALGIVYVVWGSTYLGIRIVVEEAPPLTAMGQRYVLAGLVLATVIAARRGWRTLRPTGRQLLGCLFLGLMLPLLGNGMVAVGESRGVTSGVAALLIAVVPLAIVVFRLAERDRPRPMTLAGVAAGFAGLAVLVLLDGSQAAPLAPTLVVLFAATCWALGSYLQPRLWLPADPFVVTVYEMLLGGLLLLAAGALSGEEFRLDYPARTWVALGYLVLFGSVVAFSAYVWLLARAPISLVATYAYVNPVVAVVLGWLVLEETVSPAMAVGGATVVLAVAIVIGSERRTAAEVTSSARTRPPPGGRRRWRRPRRP
jgi:drug/metabolite transporter (DMT)-like permease